jgi:hypothetical protein
VMYAIFWRFSYKIFAMMPQLHLFARSSAP